MSARLRENKRAKENEDSYFREACCLSHMIGTLALNLGYTLESPGSFKKTQMPRLHLRPIKSGFGGDGV